MISGRPGFTLVELIVASSISVLLFTFGLAAYRGFGSRQALSQAGASFQTQLRLIQQKAISGEKPTGCLGTLNKYTVSWSGAGSFEVKAACAPELTLNDAVLDQNDPNIQFSANFTVEFPVLKAEVADVSQTITISKGTLNYEITVGRNGVISGRLL